MKIHKLTPTQQGFPKIVLNIASPPRQLYYAGTPPSELLKQPAVAIVGSRKVTSYGMRATETFASDLARQGVVIISGLAIGVDSIALRAAIDSGGRTIAVLPSGLDNIYPATNRSLANNIIETGGCLITEYPAKTEIYKQNFIARNRIVSGLSEAVIITEAAEKSGSLHTARFALEQGREVGAVPGGIFNPTSVGCNNLIKAGAATITSADDIYNLLGLEIQLENESEIIATSKEEFLLLSLMKDGISESESLLKASQMEPAIFNQTLTMLEISGKAKATAGQWYKI